MVSQLGINTFEADTCLDSRYEVSASGLRCGPTPTSTTLRPPLPRGDLLQAVILEVVELSPQTSHSREKFPSGGAAEGRGGSSVFTLNECRRSKCVLDYDFCISIS